MRYFVPILTAGAVVLLARRSARGHRAERDVTERTGLQPFEDHSHGSKEHEHEHSHVTHNRREGLDELMGEWEHMTATHSHRHSHSQLVHTHAPHENEEHEHLGESHIHLHDHPDRP